MPHKGHSGQHRSNRSNQTSQGHFQSFDWYLYKMFLVLCYFDRFSSARSVFCKERAWGHHGESSKLMFSKCQLFVKDGVLIFWGNPHDVVVNSEYSQELWRKMNNLGLCHTSCFSKFVHQTLNFPSIRYIVPAKISPALPLCQKNWFCGKLRLDDFYPLLRNVASTWMHIVSKESPRPAVYTIWKIWKKIVKHNFGMKNKIGSFFRATLNPFLPNIPSWLPWKLQKTKDFLFSARPKVFQYFRGIKREHGQKNGLKKLVAHQVFCEKFFSVLTFILIAEKLHRA